ncbi:MAG: hypothetical protein ACT4O0_09830 [Pseudonocardia sp.]
MPRQRVAGVSLIAAGAVLVGTLTAGVPQPVPVQRPVTLAGASAPLVSPADRGDRGDYWRSFRRGYQIGFRDGVRSAREACWFDRSRYKGKKRFGRDRGFAAGYERGFDNGFDRTIRWACGRHR